jgi:hypothetical protein
MGFLPTSDVLWLANRSSDIMEGWPGTKVRARGMMDQDAAAPAGEAAEATEAVEAVVIIDDGDEVTPARRRPSYALWSIVVIVTVVGLSLWANLSTIVRDRMAFRYIPPFVPGLNRNQNQHLAAEYNSIAGAIVAGRGFADPFKDQTGPTAWMPPVLPVILAGLRLLGNNDTEAVTAMFVLLQDLSLIGTGLLLLALARHTTGQLRLTTVLFIGALLFYFRLSFQFTHDCWLILATLDLLIAGMVWLRPFEGGWRRAVVWGIFGGFCALVSPVVGLCWGVLALATGLRRGRWKWFTIAVLMSMLTIAPWVIRNYLLFGRLIPVKSNLAFELYQSQCVQPGGVLSGNIFGSHPYANNGEERWLYQKMGEMAYLDEKWKLFCEAVRANPGDFVERTANRFFAATLEYAPFNSFEENQHPWRSWLPWVSRLAYPLPFLSLVVLLVSAIWRPLSAAQWIVIGVYISYLLPYVIVSYYERYKFPIIVAEVMLVVWALDFVRQCWRRATQASDAEAECAVVAD